MLRLALDAADSAAMAAFLALLMLRAASGIIAAPPPPPPSPNGGVIRFAAPDALGPSKFIPPRMLASRDGAALPDRTLAGAGVMNFRPSIKPSPFSVEIGPPVSNASIFWCSEYSYCPVRWCSTSIARAA